VADGVQVSSDLRSRPLVFGLPNHVSRQPIHDRECDRTLLSIYTASCEWSDGSGADAILPPDRTRFFGYGRQALAEAIRRAGVRSGDEVLFPSFLCAEVMSCLSLAGIIPRFYDVDEQLNVVMASFAKAQIKENIRAVIAVNYFGFPQPLEPIRSWCRSQDAALIEDNAHGFLSSEGQTWLGRRGDFGVFSLRKTLSLPNGAALIDNRHTFVNGDGASYTGSCQVDEWRYRSKATLKRMMRYGNLRSARAIVAGIRALKYLTNGQSTSSSVEESSLPCEAMAPLTLSLLRRCDLSAERRRRRLLYKLCGHLLAGDERCQAIFPTLPEGVAPYGYPFYFSGENMQAFQGELFRRGLLSFRWPERLPETHSSVPNHYSRVMCISFLW